MVLGVHTAWGRTLKDVFQRYKALRGHHQRYQNGFDCQGLWIEVGVERSLGLNSKREIEEFGLAEFARRCREVVVQSSKALTEGSIRLGQWMDWGSDYFTFSDTNIEYIWRFLKVVHERGWLFLGHRSTEWCPRCGTSLSQHELTQAGVYQERSDPSLYVRFPLLEHPGESVVIWTTTPWTLPANVAAAVKPDAEYGLRENGEWVAVARYPDERFVRRVPGAELVGLRYRGPFDELGPGGEVEHRVIPWDEVSLEEGTGIVHIAPGAGQEDFELGRVHELPVLSPVDEAGRFYDAYGWLHGLSTTEAADQIVGRLAEQGYLLEAGSYVHRYPHCWRCDTPLIWRVTDDWLICGRRAAPAAPRRERDGRVDARLHGQAHGRLAPEHGRLEHLAPPLLRPPAADLPVRLRPRDRDRLAGGARGASGLRARAARGAPSSLDRRGAHPLRAPATSRSSAWPRSATCGSTRASSRSPRSAGRARSTSSRGTRRAPRRASPAPICPTTPTGRSGSPPTGSRRCASRSGSGSTPSSSCPSRSRGARRSARCSATRRCSTSPAARCTARGGTRSTHPMRSRAWAPT